MPYGKPGKLTRRVTRYIKKRKAAHRLAVKNAKMIANKTTRAQNTVAKTERVRAGDLVGSGDWQWEGSGMDADTVMELSWTGSRWEYIPSKRQPRKVALANDPSLTAKMCRGRTKDGSPCQRIGNCPVKSHKRNKV